MRKYAAPVYWLMTKKVQQKIQCEDVECRQNAVGNSFDFAKDKKDRIKRMHTTQQRRFT